MPTNECTPYSETSDVTFLATAAVTGKRFVAISAARTGEQYRMAHAAAGTKATGVATYDVASGAYGSIVGTPGRVVPVTAGGAITAGAEVEVGTTGQAITYSSGIKVGQALDTGSNGNDVRVKLY